MNLTLILLGLAIYNRTSAVHNCLKGEDRAEIYNDRAAAIFFLAAAVWSIADAFMPGVPHV